MFCSFHNVMERVFKPVISKFWWPSVDILCCITVNTCTLYSSNQTFHNRRLVNCFCWYSSRLKYTNLSWSILMLEIFMAERNEDLCGVTARLSRDIWLMSPSHQEHMALVIVASYMTYKRTGLIILLIQTNILSLENMFLWSSSQTLFFTTAWYKWIIFWILDLTAWNRIIKNYDMFLSQTYHVGNYVALIRYEDAADQ